MPEGYEERKREREDQEFLTNFNPKLPIGQWDVKHLLCCRQRLLESVKDPETCN